jgi:hypothetical protein
LLFDISNYSSLIDLSVTLGDNAAFMAGAISLYLIMKLKDTCLLALNAKLYTIHIIFKDINDEIGANPLYRLCSLIIPSCHYFYKHWSKRLRKQPNSNNLRHKFSDRMSRVLFGRTLAT